MKTEYDCSQCKYFIQHYANTDFRGYIKLGGHCKKSTRKPYMKIPEKSCKHFIEKDECLIKNAKKDLIRNRFNQIENTLTKLLEYVEES